MLLSIIIPVYNTEAYIETCVNSIINQSDKCIEIILIDDGSTDESAYICDKLRALYPSLVKVYHIPNSGVANARNVGLKKASGEYVWFVDSDDQIISGSLAILKEQVRSHNPDFISFGIREVYAQNDKVVKITEKVQKSCIIGSAKDSFSYLQNNELLDLVADKICRRSIIAENRIFFDQADVPTEDHIFWLKVYPYIQTISVIDSPLYIYNLRSGISNSRKLRYKKFPAYYRALSKVVELSRLYDCEEELSDYCKRMYCYYYLWEFEILNHPSCSFGFLNRYKYFKQIYAVDNCSIKFRNEALEYYSKTNAMEKIKYENMVLKHLVHRRYLYPALVSFTISTLISIRGH